MKRQNSLLSSSSSQLEVSSDNLCSSRRPSKTFGCVSGILHFLSKSQSRRKKCITFVHNKQENDAMSETKSPVRDPPCSRGECAGDLRNASSDAQRIAGQMPELQRSESAISTEKFRGARGPIVRLMGLESSCTDGTVDQPNAAAETTAFEKQRQVMETLEKCEQDLKALKDFIDAFESAPAESFRSSSPTRSGKKIEVFCGASYPELMFWEQQPSPVSVLDELTRPRNFVNVHGCSSKFSERPSANSGRIQSQQIQQMQRKKPGEEDMFNLSKFDRIKIHELVGICKGEKPGESPLWSSSKAMRDSVEGVCKDFAWGQKREVGRIGLALQHQICGDLIEELVKDLKFSCTCNYTSLPFEACKRRLCF